MKQLITLLVLTLVLIGLAMRYPVTDAENRTGVKESKNCYCDFITGYCEGLQVYQNQSKC